MSQSIWRLARKTPTAPAAAAASAVIATAAAVTSEPKPATVVLSHRRLTESEWNADYRMALIALLTPSAGGGVGGLPVVPLIDIILTYVFPIDGAVSTLAGSVGIVGAANGAARDVARFRFPNALCVHINASSGVKSILISDSQNHCFRRLSDFDAAGTSGAVSILCGDDRHDARNPLFGSAPLSVRFNYATGLCVDPTRASQRVYVCDYFSVRCLELSPETGQPLAVSMIAGGDEAGYSDGVGSAAQFNALSSIVCTSDGATLFVGDASNNRVRAVTVASGAVVTAAGDGMRASASSQPALVASVQEPKGLSFARHPSTKPDQVLYVTSGNDILRLDRATQYVSVLENNLPAACTPSGITTLANGLLIVACTQNHSIYSVDPMTGQSERLAGGATAGSGPTLYASWMNDGRGYADGPAADSKFLYPIGVCADETTNSVFVCDRHNHTIRRLTLPPRVVAPLAHVPAGSAEYRAVCYTVRTLPPRARIIKDDTAGVDSLFAKDPVPDAMA